MSLREIIDRCGDDSRIANPVLRLIDNFTGDPSFARRNDLILVNTSPSDTADTIIRDFEHEYEEEELITEFEKGLSINSENYDKSIPAVFQCFETNDDRMSEEFLKEYEKLEETQFNDERQFDEINRYFSMDNDCNITPTIASNIRSLDEYEIDQWEREFLEYVHDDEGNGSLRDVAAKFDTIKNEKFRKSNFFSMMKMIKDGECIISDGNVISTGGIRGAGGDDRDEELCRQRQFEMFFDENQFYYNKDFPNSEYIFACNNPFFGNEKAFEIGMDLFDNGDSYEAMLAFESVVKQDAGNGHAWKMIGHIQAENDHDELALYAFNRAIEADPQYELDILIPLTVSYINEYRSKEALLSLHKWISLHPKYSLFARSIPSNIRFDKKNVCQVIDMFLEAIERGDQSESDSDIQIALGLLYHLVLEYEKVIECFRMAVLNRPWDYLIWNKLGATLANHNIHDKAIDAYTRALEIKPTYVRTLCNLGVSFIAIKDFERATKSFLRALAINPRATHRWENLKECFNNMGRTDLALQCFQPNIEIFKKEFDF